MKCKKWEIKRKKGQIWFANLQSVEGSHITKGMKYVVVWQNDMACKYAPITNVIPLTSKDPKIPTHVVVERTDGTGLTKTSCAMTEQIRPISNDDFIRYVGEIDSEFINKIDKALCTQLGMKNEIQAKIVIKEKTIIEKEKEYIYVDIHRDKSNIEILKEKRKIRSQVVAEIMDYIDEVSTFAKMYNNKDVIEAYNGIQDVLKSIDSPYWGR